MLKDHMTLAVCAALVYLTSAVPAPAATRNLRLMANGSGICQAARPNYEGNLRKRPLGIFNEGATSAFVTCSPTALQNIPITDGHGLSFLNQTNVDVTINCTGVLGAPPLIPAKYMPKTITLPPNVIEGMAWEASDGLNSSFTTFNVSCELPPGVGITTFYINQTLDIGN